MKLAVLITCAFVLQAAASSLAQQISLVARDLPLAEAMKSVQQQSGSLFLFKGRELANAKVNVEIKNATLEEAMNKLLKELPMDWILKDQTIVIRPLPSKHLSPERKTLRNTQEAFVSGKVADESAAPIEGVTVAVKGTTLRTQTDAEGKYRLTVNDGQTLVFTAVGYASYEITVKKESTINVTLKTAIGDLDEVVVVGYGTQRKGDLTGSVATVREADIKATPIVALDRALQGRAAGVQVTTNSARPGGQTTIRIRGTGSVNASNEPLYVIDGYPTGDLNSINPSDIESIEVLKDASATAIYGSRGSNGVVMVTTKRGTSGQSLINFESYYGSQSVTNKIDLLNAREYAEFINEARVNAGGSVYFDGSSPDRPLPSDLSSGTDWQDLVFRDAPIQNYQLSFYGGGDKTNYSLSGSYYDQDGVIVNSNFKRYTVRANIDREVKSWIKVGLSMQGAYTQTNNARTETEGGASGGVTNAAINYAPVFPVYDANGVYHREVGPLNGNLVDNPLGIANEVTDINNTMRFLANAYAELYFSKHFTFRTTIGANLASNKTNFYASRLIGLGLNSNGSASVSNEFGYNWLNENTLTYKQLFADKHDVNAVLGYTAQVSHNENVSAAAVNFNDDFAKFNNLGAGATLRPPSSGATDWALVSFLARINYAYDSRYLLTLTARADGSSRFGPNKKYGFFPSGAFAWRISNEPFFMQNHWVSDAKLRISYGLTGNQGITDYAYLATIAQSTAILGGANPILRVGGVPAIISNLDLGWESNRQLDLGADLSFLENRLRLSVDYYNKVTADLLFSVNVPQTTGYSFSLQNIGQIRNRGIEITLGGSVGKEEGLQWDADFNIAFNRNEVMRLDGRPEYLTGSGVGHLQVANPNQLKVGEPLGNFYGRIVDGIFQNEQEVAGSAQPNASPGDFRYRDLDGNNVINDDDRTVIGNGYPDFIGGFNNTLRYRGFDLNIFFQGSFGNDILNYGRFDLYNLNGNNNQAKDVVNRWTPENPSNDIPRANAAGGQRILSTFQIENGSYLRLKNISLGYQLPQSFINRLNGRSIRVYVSAQNLWTWTDYTGFDPEVSRFGTSSISQGMDYGGYPAAKTFLVGLNFTL
ncbi:TonB-dependent receptor [Olivibacter sp. SDN3]|nr:TonB-dependent receptor [Olivibacter sp. SDN3]